MPLSHCDTWIVDRQWAYSVQRVPDCLGGLSRVGISSRSTRPWNGQPPSITLQLSMFDICQHIPIESPPSGWFTCEGSLGVMDNPLPDEAMYTHAGILVNHGMTCLHYVIKTSYTIELSVRISTCIQQPRIWYLHNLNNSSMGYFCGDQLCLEALSLLYEYLQPSLVIKSIGTIAIAQPCLLWTPNIPCLMGQTMTTYFIMYLRVPMKTTMQNANILYLQWSDR